MYRAPRKLWLTLVCLALAVVTTMLLLTGPRPSESNFYGVHISGDDAFIERVENSLQLLREKSPDAFKLTQRFAPRIEQSRRSGMRAYANPPTFDLSPKTANYSDTWCAGSVAHDTYHSKLYHEYLDTHDGPVPDEAWRGKAKELECIRFQARVLKDIGAPDYETDYVSQADGSHFDVDGDGKETANDYLKRDW